MANGDYVINPETKRLIQKGGKVYKKLRENKVLENSPPAINVEEYKASKASSKSKASGGKRGRPRVLDSPQRKKNKAQASLKRSIDSGKRKAPAKLPEEYQGKTRTGLDGEKYTSTRSKNGVWRWVKVKKEKKASSKKKTPSPKKKTPSPPKDKKKKKTPKEKTPSPSKEKTSSKSERKAPAEHAKELKGKVRKGSDGNNYLSKEDKNGVYRWYRTKLEPSPRASTPKSPSPKSPSSRSPSPKAKRKYSDKRKAPPTPAKNHQGKVAKGGDGNNYLSKEDKNGVWKWVRTKQEVKESSPKSPSKPRPSDRKSDSNLPEALARDHQGKKKRGKDGKYYVSEETKGGWVWRKVAKN